MFKNHFIINLDERKDRWIHISEEIRKLGIDKPTRFSGIRTSPGIVGCGKSHLACLEIARDHDWDYVTIFEDDACFLDPGLLMTQIKDIMKDQNFDVLLCGYNAFQPHFLESHNFIQVQRAYCGTMYIVKKHYYDTMIRNIRFGLEMLISGPAGDTTYAWDAHWIDLQRKDTFLAVHPPSVTQKPDYSDIEERHTNYVHLMLNNNK
jgi:GR25 family glycosyltransferase involved in LPS biosynthesis